MADVFIAGAGPAGSVAAVLLARAGHRVTLVDPGRPVAQRVESLPEQAMRLARELGLDGAIASAVLGRAVRTNMQWRTTAETNTHETPPVLLDRARLHASLRSAALAAGARLHLGHLAPQPDGTALLRGPECTTVRPDLLLDARGRAAGGLAPIGPTRIAVPFTAHTESSDPDAMTLWAGAEGWVWQCSPTAGRISGAFFTRPETLSGTKPDAKRRLIRQILPELTEIVLQRPCPATLVAATSPQPEPRLIRIGDAALARDPIGAHGLTHALRSAAQASAAARTILERPAQADAAAAYLAIRHKMDCAAARTATARAYADQARHKTAFWDMPVPAKPPVRAHPQRGAHLTLRARPAPVPCLNGDFIQWMPGLHLPDGSPVAHVGPIPAHILTSVLAQPGTLENMAMRLARTGHARAVPAVLSQLLAEGALIATERTDSAR